MTQQITKPAPSLVTRKQTRANLHSRNRSSRQIIVYAGITLLTVLAAFMWLFYYAVSVLNSALSFLKP
jgi:hypothetical protein